MKCKIEIEMDNAAFDDGNHGRMELQRAVIDSLRVMRPHTTYIIIHDANGNTVGKLEIID